MADIFGTNGSDVKDGTGEDDFISGGPQGGDPSQEVGADTLNGFGGNDVIHGLGGNDVISGNGEDDQLFGGDGDDVLNGNSGNDLIVGGAGADTMNGGTGSDTVDFGAENGSSGVTVNLLGTGSQGGLAADTAVDSFGFKDTVKNIPNVIGTSFADFIYGGNHANKLTGGGGNDYLFGGLANDTLSGGDGNDQINGGVDADTMIGSVGNDTYFVDNAGDTILEAAGEGTDTVASSVTYVLTAGAAVETLRTTSNGGTGAINLTGNAFDQTIIGNNGTNVLKGGGGKDTLQGLGGNDTYRIYTAADKSSWRPPPAAPSTRWPLPSPTRSPPASMSSIMSTNLGRQTSAINLGGNEFAR
jgi:Ca2+-binding RTX toxin-like protein